MPYKNSLDELKRILFNEEFPLNIFLQTDRNIYSFRNELTKDQRDDYAKPINEFLNDKEICEYNSLQRNAETIYYISNIMPEFESVKIILELNKQIESDDCKIANIETVNNEKIKLAIFKKGNYLLLYRYNASSILKQGIAAKFFSDKAVVEKQENNLLILSKTIPDIIVDVKNSLAFILNMNQAEYILNIIKLFKGTLKVASDSLKELELMNCEGIDIFIENVASKNRYIRKLHSIQNKETHKYLKQNKEIVPDVIKKYNLNIKFDSKKGQIIIDEDTEIIDVLHLLADDYVKRYISETDDIVGA